MPRPPRRLSRSALAALAEAGTLGSRPTPGSPAAHHGPLEAATSLPARGAREGVPPRQPQADM
eukprot:5360063-Alexandrium_andersonii.AAC.1